MPENLPAAAKQTQASNEESLPDFFSHDRTDSAPMFSVIWTTDDEEDLRFRTIIPYLSVEAAEYDRRKGIITIYAGARNVIVDCSKRLELLQKRKQGLEPATEESQTPDDMLDKLETHQLVSLFTDGAGGVKVDVRLASTDEDEEGDNPFGSD